MDPLYHSYPDSEGYFALSDCKLYYQLRGRPDGEKVVLLMGAFATLKHFDEFADQLAKTTRYNILTFDYRGIGKSTCDFVERQTSELLAKDTVALIDHLWKNEKIHVYGGSMGGMVAQMVCTLIPDRIKTLHLGVTARRYGNYRFIPIGSKVYKWLLPWVISASPEKMIESMIPIVIKLLENYGKKDGLQNIPNGLVLGILMQVLLNLRLQECITFLIKE
jgi:pimeloyl-ACP methyl ester carboxylesterase